MTENTNQDSRNAILFRQFFDEVYLFESKRHNDVASSVENVNLRNEIWRETWTPNFNLVTVNNQLLFGEISENV